MSQVSNSDRSETTIDPIVLEHDYHPLFRDADADVVIRSSDDVPFRIHSVILKKASPVFGDMLAIASSSQEEIPLTEPASVIEPLLRMISAMEIPPLESFGEVKPLALAADKYGMDGPLSMIRRIIRHVRPTYPTADAYDPWGRPISHHLYILEMYIFLIRLGWQHEADIVARSANDFDFNQPVYHDTLAELPSLRALLRLMQKRAESHERITGRPESPVIQWY